MTEFALHVPDLDETGKHFAFPVRAAWLASELAGTDARADQSAPDGRLEITAQRIGEGDVVVRGQVAARLVVDCVRCLEDAKLDLTAELGVLISARGAGRGTEIDEDDLSPEELDRDFYSGDKISLDMLVREQLLLEIPMQPLCREDCPGIPVPAHVKPPADFDDARPAGLAGLKDFVRKVGQNKD